MDLHDRLVRALAQGKGVKLSPDDLDELIMAGVYDLLVAAIANDLKAKAAIRIAARRDDG